MGLFVRSFVRDTIFWGLQVEGLEKLVYDFKLAIC